VSALRVALDGRPLQSRPLGGVGRYLAGTIPILAEQAELHLLLDGRAPLDSVGISEGIERVPLSAPPGVRGLGWLELAVTPWLRRFGGVFHGTFNMLPLTFDGRGVLTLHDLAPQLHAEDFTRLRRAAWRVYVRGSVARARAITTVSNFARCQILDYYHLDPRRVQVAPDALDPLFAPERAAHASALAQALGIPVPYIVAIGGAPRRGLGIAIDAWRQARREVGGELGLAVVGERGLPPEPGLVPLGFVDDEDWGTLLAGAQALCYPTRYEGFGLPALEALASGTPVVCSAVASLPEVLGDAACWSPDLSAGALAEVLVRLLRDSDWHRERREAGLARARAATSWRQSADVLLWAYERAHAEAGPR
jgi:glycosyltransferase involved in cell wall biosynthesis